MKFIPLPQYFIVKIDIKKQEERREKIGMLYTHFNEIQMQRNMQNGEIIAIGEIAAKELKEAKVGDTLIFHHFVEGSQNGDSSLIYSDENYNYYTVTAITFNGRRNETYAVVSGGKIIPHPDFIFIEPKSKEPNLDDKGYIEANTIKEGSLFLFTNWTESRESKEQKSQTIMNEIKNMSDTKRDDVRRALEERQSEAESITASISKKKYLPYKVNSCNPSMEIKENVYALNIASDLKIEYNDIEYTVIASKYCVATS